MSNVDPFSAFGAPGGEGQVANPFSAYVPPSQSLAQQIHPAVHQAATTPGMSLTPQQVSGLQGSMGGPATDAGGVFPRTTQSIPSGQPAQSAPSTKPAQSAQPQIYPGAPGYPVGSIEMTGKNIKPAITNQQILTQQWNQLADTSKLKYGQVNGPAGQLLAQQLAKIASQLPTSQATSLIKHLPTTLQNLVTNYIANPPAAPAANAHPTPFSDPLALQTMWKDVFGPALKQSESLLQNTGSDYRSAMSDAIAGSHMTPAQAQHQTAEARATAAMMQNSAGAATGAAVTRPAYDTLIAGLSTLAAQAQLDRAEQERAIAYGVGQTAATGAGQTGGNTASQISNTLARLGIPSQ